MHSLEANLALPHSVEPALLLRLGAGAGALPAAALALVEARLGTERLAEGALAEERARGAEERGCRGHPRYQILSQRFAGSKLKESYDVCC
jgi:hypothetical protein